MNKPDESQIQIKIVRWLATQGIFCHSVPNEAVGRLSSRAGLCRLVKLKDMGLTPGVGDLVVWWPKGIGYLEIKRPGGRISVNQRAFRETCQEHGVRYDVAFCLEDVKRILLENGGIK